MLLKNDLERCNALREIIKSHYGDERPISFHGYSGVNLAGDSETVFLLDRRHVIKYSMGYDRGGLLGAVAIAIGPIFFSAADFWSYEDSKRFKMEVDSEAVLHNLRMLDIFLGARSFASL